MAPVPPVVEHVAGSTFHGRAGAVANAFRYGVDYCLFDPEHAVGPGLLARNRRGLVALQDRDYGGPPGHGRGPVWVRDVLAAHGLDRACGRLLLLAQPRVLGHIFNPVAFWFAHDDAERPVAVIAEVSNTFGDRHWYLCAHADQRPIRPTDRLHADKIFHVSPFQPKHGSYTFRFDLSAGRVGIWIDYRSAAGERLYATLTGKRTRLTNARLLGACLRRPFGSRRVLALIHWQALRLWRKGARWHVRPLPPRRPVSR